MKIRNDFVSNSSSCSFVIRDNAAQAAKMFLEDFGSFINGSWDPMGESMNIGFKLDSESEDMWRTWQSPEQFVSTFSEACFDDEEEQAEKHDVSSIDELAFECDDYDHSSMTYLTLMYRYFDKFGFKPDASETEHEFLGEDSKSFLEKIFERLEASKPEGNNFKIGKTTIVD